MTKKSDEKNKLNATFLLNIKNLQENIDLKSKAGLICIRRATADSNEIILETDGEFGSVNQTFNPLPLITLFFDKGVDIKAQLTHGNGYCPYSWEHEIGILNGGNYDEVKFEEWYKKIIELCKSSNTKQYKKGRKIFNILKIYQNAHLLRPKFYDESYLNLLRILDAQGKNDQESNSIIFPLKTIKTLSGKFVNNVYKEINSAEYNKKYLFPMIQNEYAKLSKEEKNNKYQITKIINTDEKKLFLVALMTAYKYRSKYIHEGFELPNKIKDFYDAGNNAPMNYFGTSNAEMHLVHYNPNGNSVSIDIHKYLSQKKAKEYQKIYRLLPTWYFLNLIVREVLFNKLKNL